MPTTTILEPGMLLRDVEARTLDGRPVHVSDFRGRRNLVLIFPGDDHAESKLLAALRDLPEELREEEAVVLVAQDAAPGLARIYGARADDGRRTAAVYITDRYGEIYFADHDGRPLPGTPELMEWLRFINAQCPE